MGKALHLNTASEAGAMLPSCRHGLLSQLLPVSFCIAPDFNLLSHLAIILTGSSLHPSKLMLPYPDHRYLNTLIIPNPQKQQ
jgi:hypothetical protein